MEMRNNKRVLDYIDSISWPELEDEKHERFPVELMPDNCRRYIEAVSQSLPVPLDYPACAVLGVANAALVGRVEIECRANHREAIQLFCVMVGESGTNKTTPLSMSAARLYDISFEQNELIACRNREKEHRRQILQEGLKKRQNTDDEKLRIRTEIDAIRDEPEHERISEDVTPEALSERMKRQGYYFHG